MKLSFICNLCALLYCNLISRGIDNGGKAEGDSLSPFYLLVHSTFCFCFGFWLFLLLCFTPLSINYSLRFPFLVSLLSFSLAPLLLLLVLLSHSKRAYYSPSLAHTVTYLLTYLLVSGSVLLFEQKVYFSWVVEVVCRRRRRC